MSKRARTRTRTRTRTRIHAHAHAHTHAKHSHAHWQLVKVEYWRGGAPAACSTATCVRYMLAYTYTHTRTHATRTRTRAAGQSRVNAEYTSHGFGWSIHCGVGVTESSTNKQHTPWRGGAPAVGETVTWRYILRCTQLLEALGTHCISRSVPSPSSRSAYA
jgi:hypothetical protein